MSSAHTVDLKHIDIQTIADRLAPKDGAKPIVLVVASVSAPFLRDTLASALKLSGGTITSHSIECTDTTKAMEILAKINGPTPAVSRVIEIVGTVHHSVSTTRWSQFCKAMDMSTMSDAVLSLLSAAGYFVVLNSTKADKL